MSCVAKEFQAKPNTFLAVQFTKQNKDQVYSWARSIMMSCDAAFREARPVILITKENGESVCRIGDYLVYNPLADNFNEKLTVCSADLFDKLYQPK